MKKILLYITTCLTLLSQAQTYPVGHMSINFKDASRTGGFSISGGIAMPGSGRNIGTEVYYPATIAGNNTAVANGQFPIIVFGHGFAMTWDSYDNIYNRLASLGYIVLLPRTESSIFPTPNHADFGADLKLLASQGLLLNSISTPTALASFNGKVLQKSAIGGHSMGAGCSFIAAQNNTTVTCVFNLAAATSNTAGISSIAGASLVTVPLLMISGEKDNVADSTVQNSHYTPTTSSIKFHSIIKGVTHCDFGNGTSGTCTIGQAACNTASCNTIYFNRYMTYVEPFLAHQLKNNCSEGNRFMDSINSVSPNRVGRKIVGTIASPVNVTITGATSVCSGSQALLTASGANTYTWTNGITNGTAFTPTTTQTYSVTATNIAGCTKTFTSQVIVNASPTLTATSSNSILCIGNTTTLTASGAINYTWTAGPTNATYVTTPTTSTTYTVIGMAANGCSNTATKLITVNTLPVVTANATNSIICFGNTTTLNGGGATTYSWTNGVSNGTAFTPSITNTYTVLGTDANGCSNTATKLITVNTLPTVTANATNSVICFGNTTTLNGGGATTYSWTNGVSNGTAFTPTTTNTYTVLGTDANGCSNTATKLVTVNMLPIVTANATNSVICFGNTTTLNGGGATTYSWTNGVSNGTAFTPSITNTYTVLGIDANGCSNTATKLITVNTLPNVTANSSNMILCVGETSTLTAIGAITYTWSSGVNSSTSIVSPTVTTTYTVSGEDSNGCSNSATITQSVSVCTGINSPSEFSSISIFPNPTNDFINISYQFQNNQDITFTILDVTGKVVFKDSEQGHSDFTSKQISLLDLSQGIYILTISQNRDSHSFKIVKN